RWTVIWPSQAADRRSHQYTRGRSDARSRSAGAGELGERAERNGHPVRAVADLVAQLVERLLDFERSQHPREIVVAPWQQRGASLADQADVAGQERLTGLGEGRREQAVAIVRRRRARLLPLAFDRRLGVVERAQQAGHIAQWRLLGPALGERAERLALEVDDRPAVRPDQ